MLELGRIDPHLPWWSPGDKGTRRRREPVRAIVLHHTAGERGADGVCRTLLARGLSVHFVIDHDGRVTQHADPAACVTYHAGQANGWTVGIEIVSRGVAPPTGRDRVVYEDTVHGRTRELLRFFPEQVKAAQTLCEQLAAALDVPLKVPRELDGSLVRRLLSADEQRAFRGVCGHYHVSSAKVDPGTHLLTDLAAAWAKRDAVLR